MKTRAYFAAFLLRLVVLHQTGLLDSTAAPADNAPAAAPRTNTLAGLEETFQRRKSTLGPDHLETLAAMRSLAAAYVTLERLTNGLPLAEQALDLSKRKLGAEHPDTLSSMQTLARAYQLAGRLPEAFKVATETVKLREAKLGPDHAATRSSMDTLAQIQMASNQFTNAQALLKQLVERTRRTSGDGSRALADALVSQGECLLRQGKFTEAERPLREGVPLLEKYQPSLSPSFSAQSLLGWALLGQKKFSEAEPLLVKSYEGLKQRDARRPARSRAPVLKEAGDRIVELYEAWGKPTQAAEWRKKLAPASHLPANSRP